ncbi:hypothetical protein QMK19_18340 [Streptomyces sp. H10-C2]|uniref:hypothetical protein n=1 Tax=unclassified Streptomyces TaxID=2593676 RepID=UPI0024BAAE3E|nr:MULTISPECIES: hypothetical protein [unclassified Streptomyces]MDJ0346149.1 hypothetical protein [Streptomyces sp. PH10-H1]MDJ0371589.1 hypothetical protein [Streptomyces sp. H10-C2]
MSVQPRNGFFIDLLFSVGVGAFSFVLSVAIRSGLYDDAMVNDYSVTSFLFGTVTALVIRRMTPDAAKDPGQPDEPDRPDTSPSS